MLVSNNLFIFGQKSDNLTQNHRKIKGYETNPASPSTYKGEISPLHYRPIFTSKYDTNISDEEFNSIAQNIEQQLAPSTLLTEDEKTIIKESLNKENILIAKRYCFDEYAAKCFALSILPLINSENSDFANKVLLNPTKYNTFEESCNIKRILSYVNKVNSAFAEKLMLIKSSSKAEIPYVLKYIDEKTLPLAEILHSKIGTCSLSDVLCEFNKDPVHSAASICKESTIRHEEFPSEILSAISAYTPHEAVEILEKLYNDENLNRGSKIQILDLIRTFNIPVIKKLNERARPSISDLMHNLETINNWEDYLSDKNLDSAFKILDAQKKLIETKPELYTNNFGINNNNEFLFTNAFYVNNPQIFFDYQYAELIVLATIFDKETLDVLFRKRASAVQDFLIDLTKLDSNDLKLMYSLSKCKNTDGKNLSSAQKLELQDIILNYKNNNCDYNILYNTATKGIINFSALKDNLLNSILKKIGLTEKEIRSMPISKRNLWNINNIHLLSKELDKNKSYTYIYKEMLRAASLVDFKSYINDNGNVWGETNAYTARLFNLYNLDYYKWLSPSTKNNVEVCFQDVTTKILKEHAININNNINILRKVTPELVRYIDKIFPECISNGYFILPKQYYSNKNNLEKFLKHFIFQLNGVWKRADENYKIFIEDNAKRDPLNSQLQDQAAKAKVTVTIKKILDSKLHEIQSLSAQKNQEEINLKIKMWDRNPQRDIFQGNFTNCCIGMGGTMAKYAPQYLLNTAFNMIEINNTDTGETIGNALCYFVINNKNRVNFVIDNIEISPKAKLTKEMLTELRDEIIKYAKNISKDVSGQNNISVILGTSHNDVPLPDYDTVQDTYNFIGNINNDTIYLDLYGGNGITSKIYCSKTIKAYKVI